MIVFCILIRILFYEEKVVEIVDTYTLTNHSFISQEDVGVFVLNNVCIRREFGRVRSILEIFNNTDMVKRVSTQQINVWTRISSISSRPNVTFVEDETIYLLRLKNNPAHCLIDETLNLFEHYRYTQQMHYYVAPDVANVNINCVDSLEWCCKLWINSGLIDQHKYVEVDPGAQTCFKRLIFPKHMGLRFGGIEVFREESLKRMMSYINIIKVDAMPTYDVTIISREDTSRRVWVNGRDVERKLKELNYTTRYIGSEYASFTFEQQAGLFRSSKMIVTPHGAILSNLIFTKPGTVVFELYCLQKLQPLQVNYSTYNEKHGPSTWFSPISSRLGNSHFVYKAQCSSFNSKTLTVDVEDFMDIFRSRIQYIPRTLPEH